MKLSEIRTPITSLNGVGPSAEKLFAKLNVFTVSDLLQLFPRDYEDRRQRVSLSNFRNAKVHTVAQVTAHEWFGYGRMKTLKIIISDGTASGCLIAFNRSFLQHSLPVGSIICVTGTFTEKYGQIQSTAFDVTKLSENGTIQDFDGQILPDSAILPIYPLTEGLTQKTVRKAVDAAIKQYAKGISNEIPEMYIQKNALLSKQDAIRFIHQSQEPSLIHAARKTLIYEELFHFQCVIAQRAFLHKGSIPNANLEEAAKEGSEQWKAQENILSESEKKQFTDSLSPLQKELKERLPFSLTDDQIRVIDQMNKDIDRGYTERNNIQNGSSKAKVPFTMQRLLQGDVGSGKTLVALFACLRIISWKGQCAFMAPTEILARQHAETAAKMLEPLGITVAFLTGNIKSRGRANLLKELKSGAIQIVIGTHALFSKQVVYNDLQLAVIDEQHRFGVIQRQAIIEKGRHIELTNSEEPISFQPHLLMMSATPIPQTLALTVFGDLDVSVIHTKPTGRKPITTYLVKEGNEHNAYEAVRKELAKGFQSYFVYPAISNDSTENIEIKSAEEAFENLSKNIFPEYKCALIHSKVPEEEQVQILKDFNSGKIKVLASTTVIEVGVDVPNANCIVIEQADRFGLSQLHQLRGRVGRGNSQSFCFLVYSKKITETGIQRMKVLRESNDGFFIANQDLKLRGPGEITGTLQAGSLSFGIADVARDKEILLKARVDAFSFMQHTLQDGSGEQDVAFL